MYVWLCALCATLCVGRRLKITRCTRGIICIVCDLHKKETVQEAYIFSRRQFFELHLSDVFGYVVLSHKMNAIYFCRQT